jgi:hypothetical protein
MEIYIDDSFVILHYHFSKQTTILCRDYPSYPVSQMEPDGKNGCTLLCFSRISKISAVDIRKDMPIAKDVCSSLLHWIDVQKKLTPVEVTSSF